MTMKMYIDDTKTMDKDFLNRIYNDLDLIMMKLQCCKNKRSAPILKASESILVAMGSIDDELKSL